MAAAALRRLREWQLEWVRGSRGSLRGLSGKHWQRHSTFGLRRSRSIQEDFVRAMDIQGCNSMLGSNTGRLSIWAHGTQMPSFP